MLKITIPSQECWDERKELFFSTEEKTIWLEHSLVSLSKWESKWKKPFLTKDTKTSEETLDYIKCMTITQNVKDETYLSLTSENIDEINAYIADSMTATTFNGVKDDTTDNEIKTAELIYYYMIALNIPIEFQKWHLNRLMTLIRVCSIKQSPGKKMSPREVMARNTAINEARKKKLKTKG